MGLQIGIVTFINSPQSLNLKVAHCQEVYSSNKDNPNTNHLMNRYTARGSQAVACYFGNEKNKHAMPWMSLKDNILMKNKL